MPTLVYNNYSNGTSTVPYSYVSPRKITDTFVKKAIVEYI